MIGARGRRNLGVDSGSPYLARLSRRIEDAAGARGVVGLAWLSDAERLLLALVRGSRGALAASVDERQLAAEAGLLPPAAAGDPRSYLSQRAEVLRALAEMEQRAWVVVEDAGLGWARVRPTPRGVRYAVEFMGPALGEDIWWSGGGRLATLVASLLLGASALLSSLRRFIMT